MPADSAAIQASCPPDTRPMRSRPDGRTARARRMAKTLHAVCAEHGVDLHGSLRKLTLARQLTTMMLLAEDQRDAIARGEKIAPSKIAATTREIERLAARLDRMRGWARRATEWRDEQNSRTRAPARSAHSDCQPQLPAPALPARSVTEPQLPHQEPERTDT